MYMDASPGTNKSPYFHGGVGLRFASGVLDCEMEVYRVVGHIKFVPEVVASQSAGRYNVGDTLNHRQLAEHIGSYSTSGAYEGTLLQTWKLGIPGLFSPTAHIMSSRCFTLLADDGRVNLEGCHSFWL